MNSCIDCLFFFAYISAINWTHYERQTNTSVADLSLQVFV